MTEPAASLVQLAHRYGVATHYVDWTGDNRVVPESTLLSVLTPSGCMPSTEEDRAAALLAHERAHWEHTLAPTVVVRADRPSSFWVHVTHGDPVDVWIRFEDGTAHGACGSWRTTDRPTTSTGAWSVRRRSNCPRAFRSAITGFTCGRVARRRHRADRLARHRSASAPARCRPDLGSGDPAVQRAIRSVVGHRRPDRSDRSGGVVGRRARRGLHRWSTRCTPPHRRPRWNRRPTCRPPGASSTRFTCG